MKKSLLSTIILLVGYNLLTNFPPAKQTYLDLNEQENFVVSMGISLSQTKPSQNTIHPEFVDQTIQSLMKKSKDPLTFLQDSERIWYVLNRFKTIECHQCQKTFSAKDIYDDRPYYHDKRILNNFIKDLVNQGDAQELTATKCPNCRSKDIIVTKKEVTEFTPEHHKALVKQIDFLGLKEQLGAKKLPPYRLSLEASEVMKTNSTELDPEKINQQATWLKQLGNPFTFFHHYSNPQTIPNLFQEEWHTEWFATYCAEVTKASPGLKYFCPISQPIAYAFRLARQNNLPPFFSELSPSDLFKNVIKAHIAAHDAIKRVNPQAEIFISHQYKPFIPVHTNPFDPRHHLEKFICSKAHEYYNQAFFNELKKYENKFDGLALSVYPPVKFDLWHAIGDNCSGKIDERYSLECIMKMHEAFPSKKIFIVETGCNNPNPEVRKKFMDMTISICLQARKLGANVCGVYFWGQTNDSDFYLEWNSPRGSCNFGFFDKLDAQNPTSSVNDAGLYLKEILQN
jgi:beta-glucosidase/6-phospho-beta-glucosidase/beta-galactosidase